MEILPSGRLLLQHILIYRQIIEFVISVRVRLSRVDQGHTGPIVELYGGPGHGRVTRIKSTIMIVVRENVS